MFIVKENLTSLLEKIYIIGLIMTPSLANKRTNTDRCADGAAPNSSKIALAT